MTLTRELPADKLFRLQQEHSVCEEEVINMIIEAAGMKPHDVNTWLMSDVIYDHYDGSFEFKEVRDDWTPTRAMTNKWWKLGFSQCWICYDDGGERFYSRGWLGLKQPTKVFRGTTP